MSSMENQILNTENLIELHEQLNEFAQHHHNKGGQRAHKLIKETFIDQLKDSPRDGSERGLIENEVYDRTIKQVLSLLHREFVP